MGKLIVMGRDNPQIQQTLEALVELSKHTKERIAFIQKQEKDLKKEYGEKKQALWDQIDAEIDSKGYLAAIGIEGPSKNTNMTWDEDVMAVKVADKEDEHPLAGLLKGGVLIPVN